MRHGNTVAPTLSDLLTQGKAPISRCSRSWGKDLKEVLLLFMDFLGADLAVQLQKLQIWYHLS